MEKLHSQENKNKHLNPGVPAIITCLDIAENRNVPPISEEIEQVDLYCDPEEARRDGFIKEGERSYIFSPIDGFSKFSMEYANCTGIVAVGNDRETKENISFMSHQNPGYVFHGEQDVFIRDLNQRLSEIKQRCDVGTVDIVIFGGQYMEFKDVPSDHEMQKYMKGEYLESIKLLSEEIEKNFGFNPVVVAGPKLVAGHDFVVFNNENRRLYLTRGNTNDEFTKSFNANEIDLEKNSWKPGKIGMREYLKGSE